MAALGDVSNGHVPPAPTGPAASPAPTATYAGDVLGSPAFRQCPDPAAPSARNSNNILCLLKRNNARRTLATFFSFLTVVFLLASPRGSQVYATGGRLLDIPAFSYLLSTGIMAFLYSTLQLIDCLVAIKGYLPGWLSNVSGYWTFVFDLVLAYLLLSSFSVSVLAVDHGLKSHFYSRHLKWTMARCSIAFSFATFFFVAVSSLVSGYELCKRITGACDSYGNELDDAGKLSVEVAARDDSNGTKAVAANLSGVDGGPGTTEPAAPATLSSTALTVGHVLGSPPHSAAPVQHPTLLNPGTIPRKTNYSATSRSIFRNFNNVLYLFKRNEAHRSLAGFFSFLVLAFLFVPEYSWLLEGPAFSYLFVTAIMVLPYSLIQLVSASIWETPISGYLTFPDKIFYYGTFTFDLVSSYLLVSSSSVAVLSLNRHRKFDHFISDLLWEPAFMSIVWSFATFFIVAISSLFSGYTLCKCIMWPFISNEFGDVNKSKLWTDPLPAA